MIKFISYEPALGDLGDMDLRGIDWLICGGESGPGYRKLNMDWARNAKELCLKYKVAFFFKQDSGSRTEMRPWLIEPDGSRWEWHQYPGRLAEPRTVGNE
jgi:protein gp37